MELLFAEISVRDRGSLVAGAAEQGDSWVLWNLIREAEWAVAIRKVHWSVCFRAGLQSPGGRLIKTRHQDRRQVTMGFWHPRTRQESSYRG